MSDIFQEVDEALQQEKLEKIWRDYRSTIIAAIAVLLLSTALTTAYKNWDAKRDATETARLMNAMESDTPQASLQEVITDTRSGHEILGLMSQAGLLLEENKKEDAAALYQKAADIRSAPRDLRDLSRILYNQNADQPSIEILKPLLANEKSPWIWQARLQAATITGQNDTAQAMTYLTPFKEATFVPISLKQRAEALSHVYGLKSQKPEETIKETQETP